jgi:hypothetical protein
MIATSNVALPTTRGTSMNRSALGGCAVGRMRANSKHSPCAAHCNSACGRSGLSLVRHDEHGGGTHTEPRALWRCIREQQQQQQQLRRAPLSRVACAPLPTVHTCAEGYAGKRGRGPA